MLSPDQQDWIDQARRADILDVAQRPPVSAKLKKHTREWVGPCPVCGGTDRFAVNPKKKGGLFNCRGSGGGDVIAMVQHVCAVEFLAACEIINGAPMPAADSRVSAAEIKAAVEKREAERAQRDDDREAEANRYRERERKTARAIYDSAAPIAGTPGEAYFALRGIMELPVALLSAELGLRYADKLPYFHGTEDNEVGQSVPRAIWRGPAVLAPIVNGDGAFQGVHITWIDLELPNGKAAIVDPDTGLPLDCKKVRGSQSGCVIRLSYPADGFREWCVGEGIETTLSVWFARHRSGEPLDGVEFAAAINLGNIGGRAADSVPHPTRKTEKGRVARAPGPVPDLNAPGLPLPAGVDRVLLLGDGDSDAFDTQCAIARAGARFAAAGASAAVAWAPAGDFNDVLRSPEGVDGVLALVRAAAAPVAPEIHSGDVVKKPSARRKPRSDPSSPAATPESGDAADDGDLAGIPPSDDEFSSSFLPSPPAPPSGDNSAETLTNEEGSRDEKSENDEAERKNKREQQIADCAVFDHSDTDNGKRLITYFGDDLLVRRESGVPGGAWLHWVGTHWDIDGGASGAAIVGQQVGEIIMEEARFIRPTEREAEMIEAGTAALREMREIKVRAADGEIEGDQHKVRLVELAIIEREAKGARDSVRARRQARRKHGLSTKNRAKMTSMQECAAPHMRVAVEAFNPDPLKVATSSHTLSFVDEPDLECPDPAVTRKKWRVVAEPGHRRTDLITALVPVVYDPSATCPKWRANMERFQPDDDQRRGVQQFTGLGLLGKPIQRLMFHYGSGGNFKSVFLETITRVLGDSFAVGLPTESLIGGNEGNAGGPRPDLERLFGKRMLRVLELPSGSTLKADLIKKLTGGERWPIRTLYKSFYEFTPVAKTHMSGNDYPKFDGSDGGMQRRLLVVEWPVKIPESEQRDFDIIVGELLAEAPGILNWLIEGALDYLQHGLFVSETTRATTAEYFEEMDPVARFSRDCVEDAPGETVGAREMFDAYRAHCLASARNPVFETKFGRVMKKRFKQDERKNRRIYLDIRLHDVPVVENEQNPPRDSRRRQEDDDVVPA